jgi:O-antigen/teichoic acid export membrane protein
MKLTLAMPALGRRFMIMLSGEVLQSIFHFGVNFAVMRSLPAAGYGVFAIIFLVGGIGLTFVRSVAGVPASIFIPKTHSLRAARAYAVTFGTGALLFVTLLGTCVALVLVAWSPIVAIEAGIFVAAWGLRSFVRNMLFARRKTAIAGWSDLAFTVAGSAGLVLALRHAGSDMLGASFLLLIFANAIGILVAFWLLGEPVRIDLSSHFVRRYRRIWRSLAWSLAAAAMANVRGQGQTLIVGLLAGPAAYAPMAAMMVLFGPLRLSAQALFNLIQPEIAASFASGQSRRVGRVAAVATLLLVAGCVAYGSMMLLARPLIETHLFAGRFADAPLALISFVTWAVVTASLLYMPATVILEALGAFRTQTLASLLSALAGLPLVVLLVWRFSPSLSLVGLLVSELIIVATCWFDVARRMARFSLTRTSSPREAVRLAGWG